MKYKISCVLILQFILTGAIYCQPVKFYSTDSKLVSAFNWAREQALFYRGDFNDPVGPWYEAALPSRFAFCMRDASHQAIAAEILGMGKENENMFGKFASNISESKKWCSYWEINREDKPAPVDYESDSDFWYNLNANFDVTYACWRLYMWTGNRKYITDQVFLNFYGRTMNDYIRLWKLDVDSLLKRPQNINVDPGLARRRFARGYGLPSYAEGVRGLTMSTDLISAIYRGLTTWSDILNVLGRYEESADYRKRAEKYYEHLSTIWWDSDAGLYNTYYTTSGTFGKGEGEAYFLWFDIIRDTFRLNRTVRNMITHQWNVENTSYFPYLFYRNGYWDEAYDYLLLCSDPGTKRREYPEVSFGVIEGIVKGFMGIEPDAYSGVISTFHRGGENGRSALEDLPVLGRIIDISHSGINRSVMINKSQNPIRWKAEFQGKYRRAKSGKKRLPVKTMTDNRGRTISYVIVEVGGNKEVEIEMI